MLKRLSLSVIILLAIVTVLVGCSAKKEIKANSINDGEDAVKASADIENSTMNPGAGTQAAAVVMTPVSVAGPFGSSAVIVNTEFSDRDVRMTYEDSSATHITLDGTDIRIEGEGAVASDGLLTINSEGTYVLTGTLTDGRLIVDAGDEDKIQIVLHGVNINCKDNAPIYIKKADKVFLTLQENTENTLTDGKEYNQEDGDNVDGVIFSRADLTLNGAGSLNITGNYKHGLVSKDELLITGGTYHITAVKDTISGKDCVMIRDGSFLLNSQTGKGIESKNEDDNTRGYVYICGGSIKITNCRKGIDSTVIAVAGGVLDITASEEDTESSGEVSQ